MKKLRTMAAVAAAAAAAAAVCIYSAFAASSEINVSWDFEDGKNPNWQCLYSNAYITTETEESGNKYARISYNGKANRDRDYYDVKVADVSKNTGILQVDYDLMYPEVDTEKNGDIHIKKRTGPGSSETTIAARFGKHFNYFRLHYEDGSYSRIKDLNGQYLAIEPGHWYSVKITLDFSRNTQTVYIFDRDTQNLLFYMEPEPALSELGDINMITFSSGTDICLDNLKVYETMYECGYIVGSPYVTSATKNKYYLFGRDYNGNIVAIPEGDTSWWLETPKDGVSVDSATGRIIVGSKPEPGTVILNAKNIQPNGSISARYAVTVSQ